MAASDRAQARSQLDKRLTSLINSDQFARPPRGWIKAIREALGMTSKQLGKRLGVSQPRVVAIEKAEVSGAITLDSLERAARALDCRLVYALVPGKPLQTLVEDRASALAKRRVTSTAHSMALESQAVDAADGQAQVSKLARQLAETAGSALWDEE